MSDTFEKIKEVIEAYEELELNYETLLNFVKKIANLEGDATTFRWYLTIQARELLFELGE